MAHPGRDMKSSRKWKSLLPKSQKIRRFFSQRPTIWQKLSKTPILLSERVGCRLLRRKNVLNGDMETVTLRKSMLWKKNFSEQNAQHKDWACREELMKTTKDGNALYLHCLPADITGVSCESGEVDASVFDRYRTPLYKEASYKPYIIAAMIFLAKFADPADILKKLEEKSTPRVFE